MTQTDYQDLLFNEIRREQAFVSATFSGRQRNTEPSWQKVSLRPVVIRDQYHLQIECWDGRQAFTYNYSGAQAEDVLHELIHEPHNNFFVRTTSEEIQIRITKKGKVMVHRNEKVTLNPMLNHDRRKQLLLPDDRPDIFLQASGIMGKDGKVKAGKRAKFVQINRFLELVTDLVDFTQFDHRPVNILDAGCGSAYLTFAVHHYVNDMLKIPTQTVGVDVNTSLLARHSEISAEMQWHTINFVDSAIIDYEPNVRPDIVLALHACDTATDEALTQAIRAESTYIFSVPCCHHHMQVQLQQHTPDVFAPVMRHNILSERMGDILTDSFRALILRIMGYQTQVIEFVSPEHTARNVMIRAVKTASVGEAQFVTEYKALQDLWQVRPYLETLLDDRLSVILER